MNKNRHLASLMTPFPYSVQWEQSVGEAVRMMEEHDIRHLPVTRDGQLYGLVADTDLRVAQALAPETSTTADLQVGLICTSPPYVADLATPVAEVIDHMVKQHIGSALVTRNGQLAGIITTTDLCRYLAELLRESPPTDTVA